MKNLGIFRLALRACTSTSTSSAVGSSLLRPSNEAPVSACGSCGGGFGLLSRKGLIRAGLAGDIIAIAVGDDEDVGADL